MASANITPSLKVKNWVTGNPYTEIHDSIYVRALVIDDGTNRAAIINWELVDAGESATAELRKRINDRLGIPADHIMVNATHNHSAPWSPVYGEGHRGQEKDTWWAVRYMPPQYEDPDFRDWMNLLMDKSVSAVAQAMDSMQAVTMWLGRADISGFVQNRRPIPSTEGIEESHMPEKFNYRHPDWDPRILGDGMRFGPIDRTMTVLSFRNQQGSDVATIFHLAAHAVSIYPFMDGISGDWPGATVRALSEILGSKGMFLQGTAGDINPWRRGDLAVTDMARELTELIKLAKKYSARVSADTIHIDHAVVGIPLTEPGKSTTALEYIDAETQVISLGPVAIVTLPGEPMTGLGDYIRENSPFEQTLVLGYSNGKGGYYVGMPGEKRKGGYEIGEKTNLGTDNAGLLLVQTAVELLQKVYEKN
ncbi:MAG: hypothetical protein HKN87_10100 [Saprospiraceae bacterium]|nr:hypothetical protein [Saprospiraceae bacterium]